MENEIYVNLLRAMATVASGVIDFQWRYRFSVALAVFSGITYVEWEMKYK